MEGLTHYQVLGVQPDASIEEIKRSYRKAARHLHPDMNQGVELPQFLLVGEAFRVLSDESLRAHYDLDQRQFAHAAAGAPEAAQEGEHTRTSPPPAQPRPAPSWGDETPASPAPAASARTSTAGYEPPVATKARFVRPRALPLWAKYAAAGGLLVGAVWLGWVMKEFHEIGPGLLVLLTLLALVTARIKTAAVFGVLAALAALNAVAGYADAVLPPALLASVAAVVIARHLRVQRGGKRAMGAKEAGAYFSWGTPGGYAETMHRGGLAGALAPAGPRATDALLQQTLGDLPGVRVLHAVHLPRSGMVDHLVLAGGKIAVVESQLWPGADYCWTPFGDIAAGTSYEQSATATPTGITDAVAEVAALTGKQVTGWVLIHPQARPGALRVRNYAAPQDVRLVAAESAGAQLREWLSADNDPAVVDLRLMHWGVKQVVHA